MLPIQGLKCIYDTGSRGWAIEIALAGETPVRRFDVDGPEDAEMLIEAFEESTGSGFDPASGEIVFSYEYASLDADEDDEAEDDEAEDDEAEEAEDEDGEDADESRRKDD
jgi:hypothetical protein